MIFSCFFKLIHRLLILAGLALVTCAAFAQTYDFDHLSPGPISHQDGWMAGGGAVEPAAAGGAGLALRGDTWRNNDAAFRFPHWSSTTTNATLGFDFCVVSNAGPRYARLQLAERDEGFAGAGTIGLAFDATVNGLLVLRADGSGYAGAVNLPSGTNGHWYRVEMRVDFAANAGNGAASVFVRDLTAGAPDFAPVAALQQVGLLLQSEGVAPALFDQIIAQSVGAQLDNLSFAPERPWFGETFEPATDPAPVTSTGWTLISDTDNPTAAVTNWAANDAQNVIKLTRSNDAVSAFTSGYVYLEHDINNANETILSGNLYGQDAGDALLWTDKPLARWAAESLNLNGATFAVDYQCGDGRNSGAHFYFAVRTPAGAWYALQDANMPPPTNQVLRVEEAPIDATVDTWKQILRAGGVPGQRLRLADTPVQLSAATLSNIVGIGLYMRPLSELQPSRFDNFTLLGFTVNPLPGLAIERTANGARLTWPQTLNSFTLQLRTNLAAGTWSSAGLPIVSSNGWNTVTLTNLTGARYFRLQRP